MFEKYIFFGLLLLAVVLEVAADILFKKWSIENKGLLLGIGLALYLVGTIFWAMSLKYDFLSKAVSIFTVLNMILVVIVGLFVFKEDVSTINKIGIALGIISVILIEL
jgi:multidrug transporter EmrE-like cation transporter